MFEIQLEKIVRTLHEINGKDKNRDFGVIMEETMRNLDGSLYDWGTDVTKESFETMLLRMNVQTFVYEMQDDKFLLYLIDRREREIIKILNEQVINFFKNNVCMALINYTYINKFLEFGEFKLREWS